MRIAVVQLRIDPANRSRTLQAALRAIDQAAETDPAPDLVVLPAFADVLGSVSDDGAFFERLHGQTTAACGAYARTWGIFLALGLAVREPLNPVTTAVLLDRDGDIRLAQEQIHGKVTGSPDGVGNLRWKTVDVLLGRIGLLAGVDLLNSEAWETLAGAGAQLVVGTASWRTQPGNGNADVKERIGILARRHGLWCAMADVTVGKSGGVANSCSGVSAVFDDSGRITASAEPHQATALWAEISPADQLKGGEPTEPPAGRNAGCS